MVLFHKSSAAPKSSSVVFYRITEGPCDMSGSPNVVSELVPHVPEFPWEGVRAELANQASRASVPFFPVPLCVE